MLDTETNTPEMAERIEAAARAALGMHAVDVFFEHGQHWVNCNHCGQQWAVHDAVGGRNVDGFTFEEVTEGSCDDEVCGA